MRNVRDVSIASQDSAYRFVVLSLSRPVAKSKICIFAPNTTPMYLLTGATGFLGPPVLLQILQHGEKVRALRRAGSSLVSVEAYFKRHKAESLLRQVEWFEGDLLDPLSVLDAMQGITHVIHAAGFISFDARDKQKLYDINMGGTARVVNSALACGVKKLLYVSSVAALGAVSDSVMSEKTPWKYSPLNSVYGDSKYAGEREVWRGMEEGLNVIIAEPSIILGYGDAAKGGPSICRNVKNGLSYYPVGSHGYVGTEDVARAVMLLMNSERINEKFIISAGNYRHREILADIATAVGSKAPEKKATAWMLGLVWRWEWIAARIKKRKARITRELALTMQADLSFSGTKMLEIDGFHYTPIGKAIEDMAGQCSS